MKLVFKFLGIIVFSIAFSMGCSSSKKISNSYEPIISEETHDSINQPEKGFISKKRINIIDNKNLTKDDITPIEKNLDTIKVVDVEKIEKVPVATTKTPVKPAYIDPFSSVKLKDTFNIALILPFNLGQTPYSLSQKQNFKFDASTKLALDYYQGFITSLSNFDGQNINIVLQVLDDKNDENATALLLDSDRLKNSDIIVGPIYNKNLRVVAPFALENKIPLFSPLSPSSNITKNNPYYFSVNAGNESFYGQIINEATKRFAYDTVFMFNEGTDEELEIMDVLQKKNDALGNKIKLIDFRIDRASDTLKFPPYFADTLVKNIIIPSHNETFVTYVLGRFKQLQKNQFNILGMSTWLKFNKKIFSSKNFNLYAPTSMQSNYGNGELEMFKKLYENKYDKKPADASYQAHDMVVLLANLLYKKNFHPLNGFQMTDSNQLLQMQFNFLPIKNEDGSINYYDNHFVYFLKFDQISNIFIKN